MTTQPYIYQNGVLKPYGGAAVSTAGPVWPVGRQAKIHFVGDSLTRGQGSETTGGYRQELLRLLGAAGKNVTTVGWQTSPGPGRYSGNGGWRIEDLFAAGTRNEVGTNFTDWVRTYPADIMCLHIGTNNIGGNMIPVAVLVERLEEVLDAAWPFMTDTHLFVAAPIINLEKVWPVHGQYGAEVAKMIERKAAGGRPYHVVPGMDQIKGAENYWDGLHLNKAGYEIMAQKWADALLKF